MTGGEVPDLLRELRGELQVRSHPGRQAYLKLQPNRYGWTEEPYHEEAFRIWEGLLHRFPGDFQTAHHLAIMYHARAFDLEEGPDPGTADADWQRALELWHLLWSTDEFWSDLANELDADVQDPFPEVRAGWPEQLLQVHFDIAFAENTKHNRARRHIRLALDSPFAQEVKEKIRLRAYERTVGHLLPVVWEPETVDGPTLVPALKAIRGYLDLDEEFLPALSDMLSLLVKTQTGQVQQVNAAVEETERDALIRAAATFAQDYGTYIAPLDRDLSRLEPGVLSDLIAWHARAGQALRLAEDYARAATSFEFAAFAAQQDGNEPRQEELRRERDMCHALAAREHALSGDDSRKAEAQELLANLTGRDHSPECFRIMANTRMLLEDYPAAEAACQAGLAALRAEPRDTDRELDLANELLEMIRARRAIHEALTQARQAMEEQRWGAALQHLDEVARLEPGNPLVPLLRRTCFKGQADLEQARRGWQDAYKKLADDE
jgi:tetratricopeptide (TPR) repeat protein